MPLIFIDPHILLCPCSFPETRIQFFKQASWLVFSWFSVQCVGVTVTLLKVTDEWLHMEPIQTLDGFIIKVRKITAMVSGTVFPLILFFY